MLAIWRFAHDRGLVPTRPTISPTVLPERVPTAWTIEQVKKLMVVAEVSPGKVGNVPARLWWPALLLLLWETGERIGAALGAKWVDFNPPHLLIRAEARKGRRKDRLYVLTDDLCELLTAAHDPTSDAVLAWPLTPTYLYRRLHRLLKRAGMDGKRVAFHQIRRSVATAFAAAGGNATELLDHANPKTTKAYLDPRLMPRAPRPAELLESVHRPS